MQSLARAAWRLAAAPAGLDPASARYYALAFYAYPVALAYHVALIGIFALVDAAPLALINVGSAAIWLGVIWLHLRGHLRVAALIAILEVTTHAALAVLFVGWQTGFQYYLLVIAATIFVIPIGPLPVKAAVGVFISAVFAVLFYFYGNAAPPIVLAPLVRDAMYYANALSVFFIIALLVATYDVISLRAQAALAHARARSEEMAAVLRTMFGRYLAPEVMASLLENPASLELGGERRRVTVMLTDLRGFTALAERLAPEQVVQLLNGYFEVMLEVIERHHGTVNEFIGDSLLVLFGAPQDMPDRAERAVACALEMQNAMAEVNARNRAAGLPELEMGIGLNDAEVVVGNVGTSKRSTYSAVGAGVNLASRIESYSVGGQVLVSESVRRAAGELRIDGQREVEPKGSEAPLRIYEVGGIAGQYNIALTATEDELVRLAAPEPVRYHLLEGKHAGTVRGAGSILRLARSHAELETETLPEPFSNLRLNLVAAGDALAGRDFYGKVVRAGSSVSVHFTALPSEIAAYFEALRRRGTV